MVIMPAMALHPRSLYRNRMLKASRRGSEIRSIGKSLPLIMFSRSVEMRFVILPTRFDPFSVLSSPSPLPLSFFPFPTVSNSVDMLVALVHSTELFVVAPSTREVVSGVGGPVGRRLEGRDPGDSDFIRIRRACSNTSWVMIPLT